MYILHMYMYTHVMYANKVSFIHILKICSSHHVLPNFYLPIVLQSSMFHLNVTTFTTTCDVYDVCMYVCLLYVMYYLTFLILHSRCIPIVLPNLPCSIWMWRLSQLHNVCMSVVCNVLPHLSDTPQQLHFVILFLIFSNLRAVRKQW